MGAFMTEDQSSLPQREIDLPRNYYANGNPARVIDLITKYIKLIPEKSTKKKDFQEIIEKILSFCPTVFLDELIKAISLRNDQAIMDLLKKASNQEINLQTAYFLTEEERNQISVLAFELLKEKIDSVDVEEVLPILLFVQEYVRVQNDHQENVFEQIGELENERTKLADQIQSMKDKLVADQKTKFSNFVLRLINSDY